MTITADCPKCGAEMEAVGTWSLNGSREVTLRCPECCHEEVVFTAPRVEDECPT